MAAANLIARFEAKLDSQNAEIRAQRWLIGAILALLAALLGLGLFNVLAPVPPAAGPQPVIVMPAAPAPPAAPAAAAN